MIATHATTQPREMQLLVSSQTTLTPITTTHFLVQTHFPTGLSTEQSTILDHLTFIIP